MQVKQRLKINVTVTAIAMLIILLVLFLSLYNINRANNIAQIAGDLIINALERVTLSNDYLRHDSEKAKEQWFAKQEQIGVILKSASEKFENGNGEKTIDEMLKKHASIRRIFSNIVDNRAKRRTRADSHSLFQETEDRLLSQLNMQVYEEVAQGRTLLESSGEARSSALKLAGGSIIFVLIILVATALFNAWTIGRAITDRIGRLRDGVSLIGEGDLSYRIGMQGDDEYAALSNAFDAMTAKLSGSYHDLEDEIEERKRIEEALRTVHDELEVRVEERTNELRDLNETLEARVAKRNAELQAANETLRNSRLASLNLMEDAVSARKQAEEASEELRASEARLSFHIENSPLAVVEWDADFVVTRWAGEAERMFGWSAAETLGKPIAQLNMVYAEDIPIVQNTMARLTDGVSRQVINTNRNYTKDGNVRHCIWYNSVLLDREGKMSSVMSLVQDITDRVKAEQRLDLLAVTAGSLLASDAPQNVVDSLCRKVMEHLDCHAFFNFLVNEQAGCLRLNACAGIPEEEARRIEWLDYGVAVCGCAARDGHPIVAEHIPTTPDVRTELVKSYGINAYACHPLLGPGGKIMGTLSFGTKSRETFSEDDLSLMKVVTDQVAVAISRMASERTLQHRTGELELVNKELESFIYSVSHDLRTPLRTMAIFTKYIAEQYADLLDDKGRDYFRRVTEASGKMNKLIEDLLHLSRVSRQEIKRTNIDLSKIALSIVSDLREAAPAREVDIEIEEYLSIFADEQLIGLALTNLLGNAWKFTSKTDNARIAFGAQEQNGGIVYYVSDNGAGFEAEYAAKMFLPFQRLHSATEFEGTGIGLAIVEHAIHRHGGKVWAEGEVGKGATIYFTLA